MAEKVFYKTPIAWDVKDEWQTKEYSSWEDHNEPEEGHIYPLLCSMPSDKIICKTKEEAELVSKSALYQTSWDSDDKVVKRLEKKAAKIYNDIQKLLSNI
jgi:hypothetical protein